jgi:hypothetical protein
MRALLAGATLLLFCSGARAQLGFPGSMAPFTFNAPAAAAAGVDSNGSDASGANCYWESRGRGAGQYQCPSPASGAPKKPADASKK